MSGYTKGRAVIEETIAGFSVGIEHTDLFICTEIGLFTGNGEADAALIAEAFNVANETGRTPRQLAEERAELVGALEGAEIILAKLDTIRHLDKSFGGLDQLRAILAKVK